MTPPTDSSPPPRVAIITQILAHYRRSVFSLLCRQAPPDPEYTLVSGLTANLPGIKTLDPELRDMSVEEGGLRWKLIRNIWLWKRKGVVWQTGVVSISVGRSFGTIVYIGDSKFLSNWVGIVLARLRGKRVLMWTQGVIDEAERGVKLWLRMRFFKLAHGLLVYSNRVAHMLVERGYPAERIYVVLNSLDYDNQKAIRERIDDDARRRCREDLFAEPDLPVLVMTGRLVARKRIDQLFEVVSLLDREGLRTNVLLIGSGPEEDPLKIIAEKMGIADRVVFFGACYEEDQIGLLIASSDLCVSPGPIGLTCMHCLVYGTPIVTHDDANTQGPEYEAIVPGVTGDLFERDNIADLADTIRRRLDDPRPRDEIRRRCYRIVDELYNPHFQAGVINAAVRGVPADEAPRGHTYYPPLFPTD